MSLLVFSRGLRAAGTVNSFYPLFPQQEITLVIGVQ